MTPNSLTIQIPDSTPAPHLDEPASPASSTKSHASYAEAVVNGSGSPRPHKRVATRDHTMRLPPPVPSSGQHSNRSQGSTHTTQSTNTLLFHPGTQRRIPATPTSRNQTLAPQVPHSAPNVYRYHPHAHDTPTPFDPFIPYAPIAPLPPLRATPIPTLPALTRANHLPQIPTTPHRPPEDGNDGFNFHQRPAQLANFRAELPQLRSPEVNIHASTRSDWYAARQESHTALYAIPLDMGFSESRMSSMVDDLTTALRRRYPLSTDLEVMPASQQTPSDPKEKYATPWAAQIIHLRIEDCESAIREHVFLSDKVSFITHDANIFRGTFVGAFKGLFMSPDREGKVLEAFRSGILDTSTPIHQFCLTNGLNVNYVASSITTSPLPMKNRTGEVSFLWRMYARSPFPADPDTHLAWLNAMRSTVFSTRGTGRGVYEAITSPCSTCKSADHFSGHCPIRDVSIYRPPPHAILPRRNTTPATTSTPADVYAIGPAPPSPPQHDNRPSTSTEARGTKSTHKGKGKGKQTKQK